MINRRSLYLAGIIIIIAIVSASLGYWSEKVNPQGISPGTTTSSPNNNPSLSSSATNIPSTAPTRDAFLFGVSLGLLASAFIIGIVGFVLLIRARTKNQAPDFFIIGLFTIAAVSLILSYLVDDYFL